MTTVKHHPDRLTREQSQVFRGIKRFCSCFRVKGQKKQGLQPLIIKYIRPVSISDQLSTCNNTFNLVNDDGISLQYQHHTVNHAVGFVNPARDWVHTQTIDRLWGDLKGVVVKRRGVGKLIEQHLYRYLFVKKNQKPSFLSAPFQNVLFAC